MPFLTEDKIRALASPQSFERGVDYYRGGAVFDTRRVGDELRGQCRGSSYTPYRVSAQLGPDGVIAVHCTCPYDWGGICKHIVALLLTWVHDPDAFQPIAPVDERLAGKSKEELIALIQEILNREPDLERLLDLPLHPDPTSPVDQNVFRRRIVGEPAGRAVEENRTLGGDRGPGFRVGLHRTAYFRAAQAGANRGGRYQRQAVIRRPPGSGTPVR